MQKWQSSRVVHVEFHTFSTERLCKQSQERCRQQRGTPFLFVCVNGKILRFEVLGGGGKKMHMIWWISIKHGWNRVVGNFLMYSIHASSSLPIRGERYEMWWRGAPNIVMCSNSKDVRRHLKRLVCSGHQDAHLLNTCLCAFPVLNIFVSPSPNSARGFQKKMHAEVGIYANHFFKFNIVFREIASIF